MDGAAELGWAVRVCGDTEGGVHVWETAAGRHVRTWEGHKEDIYVLTLTPDDRYLLSGGADGSVLMRDLDWELMVASDGGAP
ncbi:hypothetical protein [Streptomyces sp. NBC_00683]|uniref:hypothetical protein n=1 Tax=Streptomyces sp. NBC_00683 TaxID=2903670 RepID=UPI002E3324D5|nr:hypothetical protein [Streptomyces sp. NBC_00683]